MTSVITPTTNTNQQGDIAISTNTAVGVVPIFTFQPDTNVNNRTKVARLAKEMSAFPGVVSARVGKVDVYREGKWSDTHHEVVEVCYDIITTRNVTKRANQPFQVDTAYFNRERLVAASFISNEDAEIHFYNEGELIGEETFTAFGVTYRGYARRDGERSISSTMYEVVGSDGNQHEAAERKFNRDAEQQAERDAHLASIADAYANRPREGRWAIAEVMRYGQDKTLADDNDVRASNRKEAESSLKSLVNAFEAQLFTLCLDLDKLRCESRLADRYAPKYEFVTRAEVVAHIATRWVEDGFGDLERGVRTAIAKEFIRKHLS